MASIQFTTIELTGLAVGVALAISIGVVAICLCYRRQHQQIDIESGHSVTKDTEKKMSMKYYSAKTSYQQSRRLSTAPLLNKQENAPLLRTSREVKAPRNKSNGQLQATHNSIIQQPLNVVTKTHLPTHPSHSRKRNQLKLIITPRKDSIAHLSLHIRPKSQRAWRYMQLDNSVPQLPKSKMKNIRPPSSRRSPIKDLHAIEQNETDQDANSEILAEMNFILENRD
jgi:hypothetical protein